MLITMFRNGLLVFVAGLTALAQDAGTPKFDPRLSIHSILREDIFAGFMANDLDRLARGEKNLLALETERPAVKAELVAWKGCIALTRAAQANEAHRDAESQRHYREAVALFSEAARLGTPTGGVHAITGGSNLALGDRLPEPVRAEAWSTAYRSYKSLWEAQREGVDQLPLHLKGELLAGVAQTAQRTGHSEEAAQFTRRIVETMPGTAYATAARRWVEKPETMSRGSIACQTCHEAGRLAARTAALK
jgi:hypothetical protein